MGALLLQFLAVLLRTGPWLYPFINYPMYATAHYEGDRIAYEHTVYAIFDDGTERAFQSDDLVPRHPSSTYWVKAMVTMSEDSYTLGDKSAAWTRDAYRPPPLAEGYAGLERKGRAPVHRRVHGSHRGQDRQDGGRLAYRGRSGQSSRTPDLSTPTDRKSSRP